MGQVSSNAGGVDDVVEAELRHEGRVLQQQGEGLTDATTGTHDSNLAINLEMVQQ